MKTKPNTLTPKTKPLTESHPLLCAFLLTGTLLGLLILLHKYLYIGLSNPYIP